LKGVEFTKGDFGDGLPYFMSGLSDNNDDLWMTTYGGDAWKLDKVALDRIPIESAMDKVLVTQSLEIRVT